MPAFQGDDVPLLIAATIDCNDLEAMTVFWSSLLGVTAAVHEPFGFLAHAPDRKVTVWLQRVPERRTGKNRLHLDFAVPDLEAARRRIEELGGSVGEQREWEGFVWRECSDPEGNVFDVMQAPDEEE
jgi:predicted enzyme related to lactoylglutathione lyase